MAIKFADQDTDHLLLLTEGELDALRDILDYADFSHRKGRVRMSSAEVLDVQSLRDKVEGLARVRRI